MTKRKTKRGVGAQSSGAAVVFAGLGLLVVGSLALFVITNRDSSATVQPQPVMTLDPQIMANLTQIPQATPLSGAEAESWGDFRALVDACDAYSDERRFQMTQHIDWLLDPSDMPPDVIAAMGSDPIRTLIFGMATYTSTQWRLDGRPAASCLIPIGRALNEMLVALGSEPFTIYDEAG